VQTVDDLKSRITKDAAYRVDRFLHDIREGKDEVVRAGLLNHLTPLEVLNRFTEEVFEPNKRMLNSTLLSIEEGQKEKFGPRSIQKPWQDRKDSLIETFKDAKVTIDKGAERRCFSTFPGQKRFLPWGVDSVAKAVKRNTNAGLPWLVKKGVVLDKEDPVKIAFHTQDDFPAMLFTRTQEGGKTRDVWGFPLDKLLIEGMYFLPAFPSFRDNPVLSALRGPDAVDVAMSALLDRRQQDEHIICEDFSKFDQSVKPDLQTMAFAVIGQMFSRGKQTQEQLRGIEDNFRSIGIVTPDGILSGNHGVPSGSWWTNVVDSIVHVYLQCLAHDRIERLRPEKSQVQGDDGVNVLPKSMDERYLEDLYSQAGIEFNADKTFVFDEEAVYLQRYYSRDYMYGGYYRGIYPIYRALNRLIHMERWTNVASITGADFFSIRAIAILENCKWHPMHEAFVKWIRANDKYNLEFAYSSLHEYVKKFSAEKTVTTINNQYSDDVSGLKNFKTFKLLKAL
jgi:hypothetical protein